MRNALLFLLCLVLCLSTSAVAACNGTPVENFGAVGNGTTDDTAAIQSALNAAGAAGGGSVMLSVKRYFTAGTLSVPQGVVLCGSVEGPFDFAGSANPGTSAVAPTLLVTNGKGVGSNLQPPFPTAFLTLAGSSAGVTDVVFYYPTQRAPNDMTNNKPFSFPFTIRMAAGVAAGAKVARVTIVNAWLGIDIRVGRTSVQNSFIGAFFCGIFVDEALDHVSLTQIVQSVFWNVALGLAPPQNIDNWVLGSSQAEAGAGGYAFVIGRVDSLVVQDVLVYGRYAGFWFVDSNNTGIGDRGGYGTLSDIDIDNVQYGVIAKSSRPPGYKFSNLSVHPVTVLGITGKFPVFFQSGGINPPKVVVNGGFVPSQWVGSPLFNQNGVPNSTLKVVNVLGWNF